MHVQHFLIFKKGRQPTWKGGALLTVELELAGMRACPFHCKARWKPGLLYILKWTLIWFHITLQSVYMLLWYYYTICIYENSIVSTHKTRNVGHRLCGTFHYNGHPRAYATWRSLTSQLVLYSPIIMTSGIYTFTGKGLNLGCVVTAPVWLTPSPGRPMGWKAPAPCGVCAYVPIGQIHPSIHPNSWP